MFLFFLPLIIIVVSQIIYDVSAKSINEDINAYAGITIIYSILAIFYFLIFVIFSPEASAAAELSKVNWAVATFALGSIGLESGYIFLYRAGWNISLGGMICNILLAMCMLCVGLLMFRETVTLIQWLGVLLCFAGLVLVFKGGGSQTADEDNNATQG
jgi:drug/metabolite transporter (DMT)-like permease